MMNSHSKASYEYNRKYCQRFTLTLNTKTDKDILDYLNSKKNKSECLKQALKYFKNLEEIANLTV